MNSILKNVLIGIAIVAGIFIIRHLILVGLVWYQFSVGCGWDDGPFKAELIDPIEITDEAVEFDLSKKGKLILENRNDTLSPILTLLENGKVQWALDTDTRNTKGYESTRIWKISHVVVDRKTDPIKLEFIGHWTFGAESGSMEIDRDNGDNTFCLSW